MLDTLLQAPIRGWQLWLTYLWQATLVVLVLMLCAWVLRRAPARWRHGLYLLALLKLALPLGMISGLCGVSLPARLGLPVSVLGVFDAPGLVVGLGQSLGWSMTASSQHVATWVAAGWTLTAVWLLGVGVFALRWRRGQRILDALMQPAERVTGVWDARLRALQRRVPGSGSATLWVSSGFRQPGVWGVRSPRIVLPTTALHRLEREELDAVLLHELAHVRRRDNLLARIQYVACALLWFHPLAWLLDRRLLTERELACDEMVLALSRSPRTYAQSLLKVLHVSLQQGEPLDPRPAWPASTAALSPLDGADLRLRMQRICQGRVPVPRWNERLWLAFAAGVVWVSLSVPLNPTCALPWAPEDQESEEIACHLDWQAQHALPPCAQGSSGPPLITLLGG